MSKVAIHAELKTLPLSAFMIWPAILQTTALRLDCPNAHHETLALLPGTGRKGVTARRKKEIGSSIAHYASRQHLTTEALLVWPWPLLTVQAQECVSRTYATLHGLDRGSGRRLG